MQNATYDEGEVSGREPSPLLRPNANTDDAGDGEGVGNLRQGSITGRKERISIRRPQLVGRYVATLLV